jgi:hypothetical protein
MQPYRELLVGTETGDDAAVWQLDGDLCVMATTDFFMPMVNDPQDFGRIAATNALSDIYAMGGKPIMAFAILGMPIGKISTEAVREILKGGAEICAAAAIPIAGGHSIDSPEPIYGLAVIGVCRVQNLRRNSDARPGDSLILTKALGVGIYSAAFKKGELSSAAYGEMIDSTTLLNRIGAPLTTRAAVHSMTDVTGFGPAGPCARNGARLESLLDPPSRSASVPLRGPLAGAARLRYRRVATELGKLRCGRDFAAGLSRMATPSSHRPADLGRASRCLRPRRSPGRRRHDCDGGLSSHPHHRPGGSRGAVRRDPRLNPDSGLPVDSAASAVITISQHLFLHRI